MVYIDDQIERLDLAEGLRTISCQRREQALSFKFEQGQRLCVAAYLLLKRALREEEGIMENPIFEYGEHGKPFIVGHPDIHFNISHCKETVLCVTSPRPVGVDVESIRSFKESLVEYTMNPQEIAQIEQAARPDVEFIRLWTMKEAVLKLSGEGISKDLKTVLTGQEQIETKVNMEKNYVYSIIYG